MARNDGRRASPRRSVWTARTLARAPQAALIVACGVLALAGLSSIVSPRRPAEAPGRSEAPVDIGAQAVAEAFARAYLTWDSQAPEVHERAVSRFTGAASDPSAGLVVPSMGSQRVTWTGVVSDVTAGDRHRIVTVAAETTRGLLHLAVAVRRDARGLLFVAAPPAVVGPPALARQGAASAEPEVDDRQLRSVAARVVRNYLAREREDLAADLHPRAVVSLPDLRLQVRSTAAITWASKPRHVAVAITAEAQRGLRFSLRYELSVLRVGGRWVVQTIHTNPIAREGDR